MKVKTPRRIGLVLVGAGRVGLMRGEITTASSRTFLNRMLALNNYRREPELK